MSAPAWTFSLRAPSPALLIALALGLFVRIAILSQTAHLGTQIVDEQHYAQIAENIRAGHGFASGPNRPTSIRPPAYPALLAGIWDVVGTTDLQAVRVVQIGLALLTTWFVYLLGRELYGVAVGQVGALVFWLYPSFVFFNVLILTETLFTFLFVAFLLLSVRLVRGATVVTAIGTGAALGLAALTRSVLWPLPLVLCPVLALLIRAPLARRIVLSTVVLAAYVAVVAPWAIRNTRLQGVPTVIDTMGGMNLRMGNYEFTPEDRMWDAVSLQGDQNWIHGFTPPSPGAPVTEGMKDKWAQRKAIEYMRAHPAQTVRRSLIKFADFWGLEREFIAGVQKGLYSPPLWLAAAGTLAIVLGYVFVVLAGAAGLWLTPPTDWRAQMVALLPCLAILGGHVLAFGHSRYHMPLIPLLGIYASALVVRMRSFELAPRGVIVGAIASVSALMIIWIRQIAIVDLPRIAALLHHAG